MAAQQKRWNLFLPPQLLADVKALAAKKNTTASEVVRTACEKYLAAVKKAEEARAAQ